MFYKFVSDELYENSFVSDICINMGHSSVCDYCVGHKMFSGAYL